jgi:hypothetical protein
MTPATHFCPPKAANLRAVMAFPKSDHQNSLITDAATGMAETPGGLGTILTQVHYNGYFFVIYFTSEQLKDHKKITHLSYWKLLQQCMEYIFITNT